jgi:hypothetical protein
MQLTWSAAIDFLRCYHEKALVSDPPRPLTEAKRRLPECLQRLYDTFGHHCCADGGLLSTPNSFVYPEMLELVDGRIVFASDCQGGWSCSFVAESLVFPVFCRIGDAEFELSPTLEDFLVTFTLGQAAWVSPWFLLSRQTGRPTDGSHSMQALHRGSHPLGGWFDMWSTAEGHIICMTEGDFLILAGYDERILEVVIPGFDFDVLTKDGEDVESETRRTAPSVFQTAFDEHCSYVETRTTPPLTPFQTWTL